MKASELLVPHARWLDGAFGEFTAPPGVEVRVEVFNLAYVPVNFTLVLDATGAGGRSMQAKITRSHLGELVVKPSGFPQLPGVVSSVQDVCDAMSEALER